jgi:hypothetical protein
LERRKHPKKREKEKKALVILKQTTTKDQIFARMNKKKTNLFLLQKKNTHTHTHKSQNLFKISLLDSTHAQARGKRKLSK